ncbi:hypothetical protein HDA40_005505 [Hamadaea flava]|nr:hypothetical protein [Hamadaea flava]
MKQRRMRSDGGSSDGGKSWIRVSIRLRGALSVGGVALVGLISAIFALNQDARGTGAGQNANVAVAASPSPTGMSPSPSPSSLKTTRPRRPSAPDPAPSRSAIRSPAPESTVAPSASHPISLVRPAEPFERGNPIMAQVDQATTTTSRLALIGHIANEPNWTVFGTCERTSATTFRCFLDPWPDAPAGARYYVRALLLTDAGLDLAVALGCIPVGEVAERLAGVLIAQAEQVSILLG